MKAIRIGPLNFDPKGPPLLVAGPCVLEELDLAIRIALFMKEAAERTGFLYVFKASFDKANRTSLSSYRGPGFEEGLKMLARIKEVAGVPVLSDIHESWQAEAAAEVLDAIQIPAFLCRQTDLILAAARTKKAVNIKKGQFMAPWDMRYALEKAISVGNENLFLTERGVSFGYRNLVVDMRTFAIMARFGYPVIFDATHSVQLPGGGEGRSGGEREFVAPLARAAVAAGAHGVFMEVHENPERARCDGPNSLSLYQAARLLEDLARIYSLRDDFLSL
ncbi:3-deoxy-8-phosphooctulonate synthase [Thermosulfuriphilus ammonigenes]|uniref:2-dehydro-3-deoxyphosphooctonate aldolase n=1 Tax=Thermosulfuriphilus ammonigenes TaxID=1936021 RepID=A0A6G7PXT3_9BACT|nr:3-deoxy-8-phosphooctulonate synthase [Thermosulfuriphilus ammonigenes]MBA2849642.1 2-dehydro-3-deoxyphosphooctonate aldolase (KDO 8-P synthase) [Thermosulfuriphilus ammonigenes]QIJ72258.1 3-deoxy-8-phosphooctulonate synthase [Thermosulfuriphilus ammonigenes]